MVKFSKIMVKQGEVSWYNKGGNEEVLNNKEMKENRRYAKPYT